MSLFNDIAAVGRGVVEQVHGDLYRIYAVKRNAGPNSHVVIDSAVDVREVEGVPYVESEGNLSRFTPQLSRNDNSDSLHFSQEKTVSFHLLPGAIKKQYFIVCVADDAWFSVSEIVDDGAGNLICLLSTADNPLA